MSCSKIILATFRLCLLCSVITFYFFYMMCVVCSYDIVFKSKPLRYVSALVMMNNITNWEDKYKIGQSVGNKLYEDGQLNQWLYQCHWLWLNVWYFHEYEIVCCFYNIIIMIDNKVIKTVWVGSSRSEAFQFYTQSKINYKRFIGLHWIDKSYNSGIVDTNY